MIRSIDETLSDVASCIYFTIMKCTNKLIVIIKFRLSMKDENEISFVLLLKICSAIFLLTTD